MPYKSSKHFSNLDFRLFFKSGFLMEEPDSGEILFGILEPGNAKSYNLFHKNFYNSKDTYYVSKETFSVSKAEFIAYINAQSMQPFQIRKRGDNDEEYALDVEDCLKAFDDSKLEKVVAVTKAEYQIEGHPLERIQELAKLKGHIYGFWDSKTGTLGCSPEILYKCIKDNEFETVSLAGTIDTSIKNYQKELLKSHKDRGEHDLVTTDIKDKLAGMVDNLRVGDTYVYNFGPIAHLKAVLSYELTTIDSLHLASVLSPTAALGGYPTDLSLSFLKQQRYYTYEKDQRSFGGVYGFKDTSYDFSYVGIRNIYWQGEIATIHSGSGIVRDSTVEKECVEVQNKRASITKAFS